MTDTDRQARRDAMRDLITRIGRGRAGADIATHLANYVNAELADADQAREELTAAEQRAALHATQLETCRTRMSTALGQTTPTSWSELHAHAEQATATLTRIRALLPDRPSQDRWTDTVHAASLRAALDGEQPATKPEVLAAACGPEAQWDALQPDHGWAPATCRRMNTRTCPPTGPCPGPCARFESDDPTPWEQTAAPEVHVHVTPRQVADAVRRVIREDHAHLRDLLR